MRILSCNVRYSGAQDGPNSWHYRKDVCGHIIASQSADIIGFQEMTGEQLAYLSAVMPQYACLPTLDRAGTGDPVNAIFHRREGLRLLSCGSYWLSETPHVAGSRSWASDCIRLAAWAHFAVGGETWELRIVNTHLDHISQTARLNQARMINEDAGSYAADFPQVLTGDMNSDPSNPVISSFLESGWIDTYQAVHGVRDPGFTAHDFLGGRAVKSQGKIDWIFTRGAVRPLCASIVRDTVDGRYPSDHYFVSAVIVPEGGCQ